MGKSFLYIAEGACHAGVGIKVGITNNPKTRLSKIRTIYNNTMNFHVIFRFSDKDVARKVERVLIEKFKKFRTRRSRPEYFIGVSVKDVNDAAIAEISRLNVHGDILL